jgi:uncharacterized protein (DUF3084 family)
VKHHVQSRLPVPDSANGDVDIPSSGGIVRSPDSLPVLEAFQRFLDVERRKTRKRLLAVAAFSFLLILIAAGAAVVAGMLFAGQVKKDVKGIQDEIHTVKDDTQKYRDDVQKAFSEFTAEAEKFRDEVAREQASSNSELTAQINNYNDELTKLKETFQDLEMENNSLKGELARLSSGFPLLSNDVYRVVQDVLRIRQRAETIGPVAAAARAEKKKLPAQDLIIAVTPASTDKTVAWCLPIPE